MFNLQNLLRENIKTVKPYASARDEYTGTEGTFLDANENPFGSVTEQNYNRYPDPKQQTLKEAISKIKGAPPEQIFVGNGSDEAIDLLYRAVATPGIDNVIIMPPTYGMYEVSAGINDIKIRRAPLDQNYQIQVSTVLGEVDEHTKMVFVCSPNNPTGNLLNQDSIEAIIKGFDGIVVVDEAYIDFVPQKSMLSLLPLYPNLVVLHTFSKAWGLASLRLGMCFASPSIIEVLNKIKPPYNISGAVQDLALKGIRNVALKNEMVDHVLVERQRLAQNLALLPQVQKVYPSDSNFLLVTFTAGHSVYNYLVAQKIITRDRSKVAHCSNSLRITVGTESENDELVKALLKYNS